MVKYIKLNGANVEQVRQCSATRQPRSLYCDSPFEILAFLSRRLKYREVLLDYVKARAEVSAEIEFGKSNYAVDDPDNDELFEAGLARQLCDHQTVNNEYPDLVMGFRYLAVLNLNTKYFF